jgi:Trk-type K+ transport system membrane component
MTKQILKYPRSHFTHIYTWNRTVWLVGVIMIMNWLQIALMCIMNWNSPVLTSTPNTRSSTTPNDWYDGIIKMQNVIFQSISTRTAGFNSLVLSEAAPSVLVLYVIMMYISAYPITFSVHKSAQLIRQSPTSKITTTEIIDLQDRAAVDDDDWQIASRPSTTYRIQPLPSQKRKQEVIQQGLTKIIYTDLAIVSTCLVLICCFENSALSDGDINFTIFTVIFEVVSAYGTVGLSLGYPNAPTSFCGKWRTISKLILMFTMLSGRHRGLPASHDLMFGGKTLPSPSPLPEEEKQ